jgi:intraflagellar transport protein 52
VNIFLDKYGIRFKGDMVVRTSYHKYPHPKECLIENCRVHPDFLRSIKSVSNKKKIVFNDDLDNEGTEVEDDGALKFVYPFGQSLDVEQHIGVIINSGIIAYPANRPLAACSVSKNKKGKIFVLGSEKFFEDDYLDKEENKKVAVRKSIVIY